MRKYVLCIVVCFNYVISFAQGIQDSVFRIPEVEISEQRLFQKADAGLKQTRVDSLVLLEKISADLSEVLAENTPVYIKNYGRGALSTASFRGTAPSHTQVSWNGININSPMLGMVDFSLIPVNIIDDLTLQHGAASVSEQSGGLGGHISIRNKVDWKNRFSGRYHQGVGSFHTFSEFAQINLGSATVQSKTRAYQFFSKNNYDFLNKHLLPEPEVQRNQNADYGRYGVMQEVYYRPLPQWQLSAKVWWQDAYRSIPTVLTDESSDDSKERINRQDDRTVKAVVNSGFFGDAWTFKFHSGFDFQEVDYVNGYTVNNEENLNVNSGSDMQSWYNQFSGQYRFSDKITVDLKGDYNLYDIASYDTAALLGYDVTRQEASVMSAIYYEPFAPLQISVTLRQNWLEKRHTPMIYTFGINYKPITSQNLVFKGSITRNFRNPSLNDMYWQPGGNPDLKAEKGYTIDGGLHYLLQKKQWSIESQFTGYYSQIDDWIIWLPGLKGPWEPYNLMSVEASGIEMMLKTRWSSGNVRLYLMANYAFTQTVNAGRGLSDVDISEGKQLPFIPKHSGNIFASAAYDGYYINYQHNSYSTRYLLYSNNQSDGLYPYHLNHASVGRRWHLNRFKINVELQVKNLFDEFYRSILNRFMPGRNYMLMVKVAF